MDSSPTFGASKSKTNPFTSMKVKKPVNATKELNSQGLAVKQILYSIAPGTNK